MSDAVPSTDKPVVSDDGNIISLTDFTVENFKPYMKNLFYRLDGMTNFYFVCDDKENPQNLSQTALAMIFNALYAFANRDNIDTLKKAAEDAEKKAQEVSAELASKSKELSSAQRSLSTLLARYEAFKPLSTSFEAIKGELVNGDGLVGEDGQPVGSKGLIEFVQFLKDFYDEHGEVLGFPDYDLDFKNALDSISTLMQDPNLTTLDEFAKKWEGDAGLDGIKDYLARMYNCAWGDSGGLKQTVDELNDSTSNKYSSTLFYLATHEMEEDFCMEEDAVPVEGEDKKKGPPLLTKDDDIQFSNQDIYDLGHAMKYSIFGFNFMGDCLCVLADTDKEAILASGGANKNEDGKWEYDERTFETPDEIFSIYGENDPDKKFAVHFFDEAVTQEVFVKDENYEKIREIALNTLVEYDYIFTDAEVRSTLRSKLIDQLGDPKRGYLDYRMQMCKSMLVDLQTQAKIVERYFYSNDTTGERPNNAPDVGGFSKNAKWDGLKVLLDMYSDPKEFFGTSVPNWDDTKSVDENVEAAKNSLEDEIKQTSTDVEEIEVLYSAARSVADEAWLKYNTETKGDPNDLLNLALRYNTASGIGHKICAIQRTTDGTYYSIEVEEPVTNPDSSDVTAERALENMALPYYVLAVCLEKALAIKDIMTIQMQEVESINEEIKTNNAYLRQANAVYQEYYDWCIKNEGGVYSNTKYPDLDGYVQNICDYSSFTSQELKYGVYNTEGGTDGGDFHNVDVEEQGNLTKLSNAQEAIRMYGDTRSTKSQMKVTELQQAIQNYNACITICAQMDRSIMEPYKGIANNTRY